MSAGHEFGMAGPQAGEGGEHQDAPAFFVSGSGKGEGDAPLLLSVPHAGREYPAALLSRARAGMEALIRLEDRFADLLIADLVGAGYAAIVARTPRAMIDLNRDPRDIDRNGITAMPRTQPLIQSVKQRGGLGLFPRSLPRHGDLWRGPVDWAEASRRIAQVHHPYHSRITAMMEDLHARHGQAMLLDVHSMPPLSVHPGQPRPDIVIGDRFGASASSRFSDLARTVAGDHGFVAALNHPYPGSYLIERHGQPGRGKHALQIEISRDLYLDSELDRPGPGLERTRAMLTELARALADEMIRGEYTLAAE